MNDIDKHLLEELKMLQDVIKRMASNSFLVKGWAITLVTVTLLMKVAQNEEYAVLIAVLPLVTFWVLDAFYLRQERLFRKLYQWLVENRNKKDSNESRRYFDFNTQQFQKEVKSTFFTMFSTTLSFFYIPTFIIVLVFYVLNIA